MANIVPIIMGGRAAKVLAEERRKRKLAKEETEWLQAKVMAENHQAQFGSSSHYEKWKAEQLKKKK